jgi:MFS family permease
VQLPKSLQNRWWIVFASAAGLTVGTSSILFNSFAVFVKPVSAQLGWSRSQFSFALTIVGLVTVIASPLFGSLIDRYRIKKVSLPLIAVFSAAVAGMSLMGPALPFAYGMYALCALVGPAQAPLMYSKAIALWFDRELGIALGLATAGLGLGTVLIPLEAQYLIAHFGWRMAYVGLGLTNFVVAFSMTAVFIREPSGDRTPEGAELIAQPQPQLPGNSLAEAACSWRFWALTAAFTLGGIANGALVHVVALLTDRGISALVAAQVLASSGIAVIAGRLLGGYLLDRSKRPLVPSLFMLLPALGSALLASGISGAVPVIAVMMCGFGVGIEINMMGFFVSRYFGRRAFGKILGFMWPGFAIGASLGPLLMARSYDLTHSYKSALIGNALGMIVATCLLAGLGSYGFAKTSAGRHRDDKAGRTVPTTP